MVTATNSKWNSLSFVSATISRGACVVSRKAIHIYNTICTYEHTMYLYIRVYITHLSLWLWELALVVDVCMPFGKSQKSNSIDTLFCRLNNSPCLSPAATSNNAFALLQAF